MYMLWYAISYYIYIYKLYKYSISSPKLANLLSIAQITLAPRIDHFPTASAIQAEGVWIPLVI